MKKDSRSSKDSTERSRSLSWSSRGATWSESRTAMSSTLEYFGVIKMNEAIYQKAKPMNLMGQAVAQINKCLHPAG